MEAQRQQPFLEPTEVVIPVVQLDLACPFREMKAVNNPRIIALELENPRPGVIGFHGEGFLVRLEIDRPAPSREISKGTPFGRNEGGMITILAWSNDTGMLVKQKSDIRLESKTGAFQYDFGRQLGHGQIIVVSLRQIGRA